MVKYGIISFGLGALLSFIINVSPANAVIICAGFVAGILSYVAVLVNVANKAREYRERVVDEVVNQGWDYLSYLHSFLTSVGRNRLEQSERYKSIDRLDSDRKDLLRSFLKEKKRGGAQLQAGYPLGIEDNRELERKRSNIKDFDQANFNKYDDLRGKVNAINNEWLSELRRCDEKGVRFVQSYGVITRVDSNKKDSYRSLVNTMNEIREEVKELYRRVSGDDIHDVSADDLNFSSRQNRITDILGELRVSELSGDNEVRSEASYKVRKFILFAIMVAIFSFGYVVSKSEDKSMQYSSVVSFDACQSL